MTTYRKPGTLNPEDLQPTPADETDSVGYEEHGYEENIEPTKKPPMKAVGLHRKSLRHPVIDRFQAWRETRHPPSEEE